MSEGVRGWSWMLIGLLVAGCSGAGFGRLEQRSPIATASGAELFDWIEAATPSGSMPLATLAEAVVPDQVAHDALERAVAVCMSREGFAYEPLPFVPFDLFGSQRYGLTDEEAAAQYGYEPPGERILIEDTVYGLPEIDQRALFGDGEIAVIDAWKGGRSSVQVGGCIQVGADEVYGDYVAWAEVFDRLQWLVDESARERDTDPRAQAALAQWVTCMGVAGYVVTSLEDAPSDGGPAAAVADARCHTSSNLAGVWAEVETEVQWELLPEHADVLAELIARTTIALSP